MAIELADGLLREFRRGDEESLVQHANDRRIWRNLKDAFPHPYTLEQAETWVEYNEQLSPPQHFAVVVDAHVVGAVGLEFRGDIWRYSAELGYWIAPPYWGRGLMTTAVRAVVDYAFATYTLNRIWAGAFDWNPASARVLEKAGFRCEGRLEQSAFKDGAFVDELIYAMVRPMRGA